MKQFAVISALVACVLAGAALAVALSHGGPRGPQGPAGPVGHAGVSAAQSRFGVCWNSQSFTQTWSDGSSSTWLNSVTIDQAVYDHGVYTCPQGDTFVSIVPGPAVTPGG